MGNSEADRRVQELVEMSKPFGRVEKRTYAGSMLRREFFTVSPRITLPGKTEVIRPRFQSADERRAHRTAMSRKRHIDLVNTNFRPGDLYLTMTFDRKNECHCYEDAKKLVLNYIKRIRRVCQNAVIFWYIGRGENTDRYHAHFLMHGVSEEFAHKKWGYGRIEATRRLWAHCMYEGVDHGADYSSLANYLFDHWEPEQGPHRYHHTRNARKPDVDGYRACRRNYSEEHPPAAPKGYKLVRSMCTRYGYQCFTYVIEPGQPFLDFDAGIRKPKRSRNRRARAEDDIKE